MLVLEVKGKIRVVFGFAKRGKGINEDEGGREGR